MRASRSRGEGSVGPDYLHANRLTAAFPKRRLEAARKGLSPRATARHYYSGTRHYQAEIRRAGRPRGHPAQQCRARPGERAEGSDEGSVPAVQAHLEPLRRLARWQTPSTTRRPSRPNGGTASVPRDASEPEVCRLSPPSMRRAGTTSRRNEPHPLPDPASRASR